MRIVLELMALLQLKHLVADWIIQPRWMHQNKGTFGHPGGIAHSGFHALLTGAILFPMAPLVLVWSLAAGEFFVHYLIDWGKMNLNRGLGLVPRPEAPYVWPASEGFWILVGLDQWLHQVWYLVVVWAVLVV